MQNTTHVFLKNLLCDIEWVQVSFTETYNAGYFFLIEVAWHVALQQHGSTADTYTASKFPI